jgi:pimeloyl-ACP methyl ester carboxylesterase
LLFLSGGPGGSEAGRVLRFNQELEKHFVVAIWEQRGCGKSYPAIHPKPALTVEQYAADIVELAEMLRARFDETKIYLVGHSWGTIIGVRAIQERPDLFYAYVGAAQMVNALEADRIIYDLVEEHARETGDTQFLQVLKAQGPPPYGGKNPVGPYARIFTREYQAFEMSANKSEAFRREGDLLMLALRQPEYGWVDRINYLRGLMDTFNVVYPQLQTFDFRRDAPRLELPIYLVLGRHDTNAPSWLSEDYFNLVQAPSKELVFFEDSGHGMIWQEPSKFHDLMVHSVLPATYQP